LHCIVFGRRRDAPRTLQPPQALQTGTRSSCTPHAFLSGTPRLRALARVEPVHQEQAALKMSIPLFALLVVSVPASAIPPPWGEVVYTDAFESLDTCASTIVAPDGLERTRLLFSDVRYTAFHYLRPSVHLTEWDNVWGYNNGLPGPPVAWPGVTGSSPIISGFGRWSYVALHFHTPAVPLPGLAARMVNSSSAGGPPLTVAISKRCGDFQQSLPTSGCLRRDVPHSDETISYFKFTLNHPELVCNLEPDSDYYINIMLSDPASAPGCPGGICPVGPWRSG
jgi:hypothetical protein